ncbi:leucine carboxyl methyltransferase [Hysterangium stoloniferum]|nr:leucine carboxyl methyltransferase [Hysterangium stoloniferum]
MLPRRTVFPSHRRDPDASIRGTDSDASQARISAVRKQYLNDPFIGCLVPQPHLVPSRPPLINIGTYIRSEAIDELVYSWIRHASLVGKRAQIVSLGAGSDTRFWRIASDPSSPLKSALVRYLELDFSENTSVKVRAIKEKKELHSVLGEFTTSETESSLTSSIYAIRDVDLRQFQNSDLALLDPSVPTLVLAECVLVYMDPTVSDALLKWFSHTFSAVGAVIYEMFGLNDNFGRVMKENLRSRNVTLPGVDAYPTLEAQCHRLTANGFTYGRSLSLKTIRSQYIDPGELSRIAKLEFLDELEELELVLNHYAISWGTKGFNEPSTLRVL